LIPIYKFVSYVIYISSKVSSIICSFCRKWSR